MLLEQVTVQARDGGSPQRTAQTLITVNILKNTPPFFNQNPVTLPQINVDASGTINYDITAIDSDTVVRFFFSNLNIFFQSKVYFISSPPPPPPYFRSV